MKTKQSLDQIVSDIEKEFSFYLAKSEDAIKEEAEDDMAEDKKTESKVKSDKMHGKKEVGGFEKETEPKEKSSKEPKSSDEAMEDEKNQKEHEDEEPKEDSKSHGYSDSDIEELHKMYGAMGKSELDLHKKACDHHWANKCGEMDKCDDMPMAKSAKNKAINLKGDLKIEQSVEMLKSENADLKKTVEDLVQAMTKFVAGKKAPTRKAITEISVIEKSEKEQIDLSRIPSAEITKILSQKTMEKTLSKSDRELIDSYYFKKVGVDAIAHLLK